MKKKLFIRVLVLTYALCSQLIFGQITVGPISLITIEGETSVSTNDVETYTRSSNTKFTGTETWSVTGGIIQNQSTYDATVKWTESGEQTLTFTINSKTLGILTSTKTIIVDGVIDNDITPPTPVLKTLVSCTYAQIEMSGEAPSNITWYWQGTNPNGISTSNSSETYNVTASGTYYLRAKNAEGIWSPNSSYIIISLTPTWYSDEDGDGLGNPINIKNQCTQPLNYVANSLDECPTENGEGTINGCTSLSGKNVSNKNYIHTIIYKEAFEENQLTSATQNSKTEGIAYFDGLGRVEQSIAIANGGNKEDIVSYHQHDALGRETKDFLPFANSSYNYSSREGDVNLAAQYYYKNKFPEDFNATLSEVNAYSEKTFEDSPLNRVLKQGAPGKDWNVSKTTNATDHAIKFNYQLNATNEVKHYSVTTVAVQLTSEPTLNDLDYYKVGQLYKTITKDENWTSGLNHTTEEFKNKLGQVILKRTYALVDSSVEAHDTFYVYDDYGNLTYVFPPKAAAQNTKPSTSVLDELCYQYKYDHRNRLVEKKIPGKGWEYIVYDKLDRPILTQDAIQHNKTTKEWLFTKYDKFGRVIYTGLYKDNNTRTSVQASANNASVLYDSYLGTYIPGSLLYYSNNAFPTNIPYYDVYTVNYYDETVFWDGDITNPEANFYGTNLTTNTKGLPTTTKVKILEVDNKWITTNTGYDEKARPIYISSKNDYLNTTDIVESKLDDFTGKVLETRASHQKTGQDALVTIDRFEYDHMDRLISQNQQINEQISERIVKNNYDDLGQLESKLIGNGTKEGYTDVTSGISIDNNLITKTGTKSWSHGLATLGNFSGNGYVEFSITKKDVYFVVGLSSNNENASYTSINYSIICRSNNTYGIYENSSNKKNLDNYTIGDVFKIERIGNTIYYKKNDEIFYTSLTPSSGQLLGDISMNTPESQIKDFKIVDNSKGLQKVDYNYNVRGWLKNINEDIANDNDLFNFSLYYNNPNSGTALYNGNISQTNWNSASLNTSGNPVSNEYTYSYDALNRITGAIDNTSNYDVSGITYDKNGNIQTLLRKGLLNPSSNIFGTIDNLNYTYDSGNKLTSVTDNITNTAARTDFTDGNTAGNDYTYDVNGNMIADKNKNILNIEYNHLNLPTKVRMQLGDEDYGNILYIYDATGVKLKKIIDVEAEDPYGTIYAGNFIYKENTEAETELQFFNHPEGYVQTDNTGNFDYVYQYKDHLGNVRLSYTDADKNGVIDPSTEIIEESNYYPFGLKHKGYNNLVNSNGNNTAQKFGYNGKELNEELGLEWHDFGARNYDASLGRWMNLDPLAEQMRRHSPYNFGFDNPIYYVDPDGMAPFGPGDGDPNEPSTVSKIKEALDPITLLSKLGDSLSSGLDNIESSLSNLGSTIGDFFTAADKNSSEGGDGYNFVSKDGTNNNQRDGDNSITTINADNIIGSAGKAKGFASKASGGTKALSEVNVKNVVTAFKNGFGDAKKINGKVEVTTTSTLTKGNRSEPEDQTTIKITNVIRIVPAFGNNGRRVLKIEKDTLVNKSDVKSVQQKKQRALDEANKS